MFVDIRVENSLFFNEKQHKFFYLELSIIMEGQLLLSLNSEMRILSYKNIVWTIGRLVIVGPKQKTLRQFCFSALMPNNFSALAKGRQLCT